MIRKTGETYEVNLQQLIARSNQPVSEEGAYCALDSQCTNMVRVTHVDYETVEVTVEVCEDIVPFSPEDVLDELCDIIKDWVKDKTTFSS